MKRDSVKRKILVCIVGLAFTLPSFAQKTTAKSEIIKDLRKIDSLYRQLEAFVEAHVCLDLERGTVKLYQWLHNKPMQVVEDSLIITTALDSIAIRHYCNKTQASYATLYNLLQLMVKNEFVWLSSAGPGDCVDCSSSIISSKYTYIVLESGNSCMPDDCFEKFRTTKNGKVRQVHFRKFAKDMLVKKRHQRSLIVDPCSDITSLRTPASPTSKITYR
jgi:hypothetical protein